MYDSASCRFSAKCFFFGQKNTVLNLFDSASKTNLYVSANLHYPLSLQHNFITIGIMVIVPEFHSSVSGSISEKAIKNQYGE